MVVVSTVEAFIVDSSMAAWLAAHPQINLSDSESESEPERTPELLIQAQQGARQRAERQNL